MVADTPRIRAKGYLSKSEHKYKSILILTYSGATMRLIHSRIVRRLGLKVNIKGERSMTCMMLKGSRWQWRELV